MAANHRLFALRLAVWFPYYVELIQNCGMPGTNGTHAQAMYTVYFFGGYLGFALYISFGVALFWKTSLLTIGALKPGSRAQGHWLRSFGVQC